ncbi:O-antigen ligase family protein [Dongshaea marina]|uniref:O-antigen ligase family protein n=1 Tax=Dongshaea marina TaxID=2047966 RepID=UPI000D3ED771|nr:O-antigen ligase family protein [Dongshaea marina]
MLKHFIPKNMSLHLVISIIVFLFAPLSLIFSGGYNYSPALLLLIALPFLFIPSSYRLNKETLWLISALLLYFFVYLSFMLVYHEDISQLDRPSRAIMAVAILILLLRYPPKSSCLLISFALGAIVSGIFAGYQKFFLHMPRALSNNMPIQAGDICMAFGTISLVALFYHLKLKRYDWSLFYLLATFLGVFGSVASQSRGGWLLFPFILIYLIWTNRAFFSRRLKIVAGVVIIIIFSIMLTPKFGIQSSINKTIHQVDMIKDGQYLSQDSSIGTRLLLWSSAWRSFAHKPLTGWSQTGLCQDKTAQYNQGELSYYIYRNWACNMHAHSEYFDSIQKRGIIGFLQVMAVFLIPLIIFIRHSRKMYGVDLVVAQAGAMIVISSMGFGFSQLFFGHNSGSIYYFFTLVLFYSALSDTKDSK